MKGSPGDKIRLYHIMDAIAEIDWKAVVAMRNVLVHEYFAVSDAILWGTVTKDLPILKKSINTLIDNQI